MQGYNRLQPTEFDQDPNELSSTVETVGVYENDRTPETVGAEEYSSPQQSKPPKKKKGMDRLLTGFLAATMTVTAGAAAIVDKPKATAEILEYGADYSVAFYHVRVEGQDELTLILYNDFTYREVALEEGENPGAFETLQPGLKYTMAVVKKQTFGQATLDEKIIYTLKAPPEEYYPDEDSSQESGSSDSLEESTWSTDGVYDSEYSTDGMESSEYSTDGMEESSEYSTAG